MEYIISFLEGIITFISPCLLPMIPVYISYFAGGEERSLKKTLFNAFGFVLGFTILFVMMGAFAGSFGGFLVKHRRFLDVFTGLMVIFFGLNFLGVFKLNIFKGVGSFKIKSPGFFSTVLFGAVFSVGWTPCVGAFLGSALMLASNKGSMFLGIIMLLFYSLGLGIPFIISAVLIDQLKSTFNFIKRHYNIINRICGCFLVIVGIFMLMGVGII